MIKAIQKSKLVQEFDSKEVELEKVEEILQAAMYAPSSVSSQPFEFVVVDNMEILKKMASYGMHVLKKTPMAIVLVQKEVLKRRDMGITFLVSQDMGVCIENILLQAYEEGLSAAWVAVGPNSDAQRLLSELLHLPDYVKAHSVVAVGYSAKIVEDESIDRFDESRIHYNKY